MKQNQYLLDDSYLKLVLAVPKVKRDRLVPLPPNGKWLTTEDLDTWVRIHLWPEMGLEPKAVQYAALVRARAELFGKGSE